jgi:tetratricopeptide (TPR) repeat protein
VATLVDHVRLFRNHPQIRWIFRVHEQILPGVKNVGGAIRWSDVVIHHTGYQDKAVRARKLERDSRLLLLEFAEQPDNTFTQFNLGSIYREQGRLEEAIQMFERSLTHSQWGDSITRKLHVLLAQSYRQFGQVEKGLAICRQGLAHFAGDPELLFQQGVALRALDDQPGAEQSWRAVLTAVPGQYFASVDVGLQGFLTHHNLAGLYQAQGRLDEALRHWAAALADRPGYLPALIGLGECHLLQRRWDNMDHIIRQLEGLPEGRMDAEVMRARRHLAWKEYGKALQLLRGTKERYPAALWPRVVHSHVLLQEGKDWVAAEQALREILELEPGHSEARQNLIVLLRQQGRMEEALAQERIKTEKRRKS